MKKFNVTRSYKIQLFLKRSADFIPESRDSCFTKPFSKNYKKITEWVHVVNGVITDNAFFKTLNSDVNKKLKRQYNLGVTHYKENGFNSFVEFKEGDVLFLYRNSNSDLSKMRNPVVLIMKKGRLKELF